MGPDQARTVFSVRFERKGMKPWWNRARIKRATSCNFFKRKSVLLRNTGPTVASRFLANVRCNGSTRRNGTSGDPDRVVPVDDE